MDIKDFITISLVQIAEGTAGAQDLVAAAGGYVNPAMRAFASAEPSYA